MHRAWFVLAFLLTGCAAVVAPMGDTPGTPMIVGNVFTADDGLHLPLRIWAPEGKPKAVVIALHGMSDYSNAFDMPGRNWAGQGILTLAYDQRGFGAGPNPGLWAGSARMREDLQDAVAAAHASWPGVPVYALGESMGGAVLLTALADPRKLDIAGAILVVPAVWSRSDMPLSYRVALFFAAHFLPGLIVSNSAASHVVTVVASDNVPMLRALGRDPLFQKQTRADALFGLVNLMDEARSAPAEIHNPPPILLAYGAHDQVIPAASTQAVIAALRDHVSVQHYDQGYHMLLRDLEGTRVQDNIAVWIAGNKVQP
jgi:acylglycerol lipase